MKPRLKTFWLAILAGGLTFFTGCGGEDLAKAELVSTVNASSDATNLLIEAPLTNNPDAQTNEFVAAVPPKIPDDVKLSNAVDNVIKMAQSGVGDPVLLAYIQNSTEAFDLEADEILYLTDIGLSEEVLTAMLNHDGASKDLMNQAKEQAPAVAAIPSTNSPIGFSSVSINPVAAGPGEPQQPPQVYEEPPLITDTQPVVTYDTFYSSLSPYGTWVDVPAYGWCWEPTVAVINPGWRPYCNRGRWLNSDCGWYWQSDYSWGWAPFHYGRWYQPAGRGWCWVPDRVWGPSWVSWRQSSGFCGWAALPPAAHFRPGFGFSYHDSHVGVGFGFGLGCDAFTFVPVGRFCDRAPYQHAVSRSEATTVYNHTTVVNNYITGNNHTVINQGIDPAHVAAAARTEIRKVSVRDIPAGASPAAIRPEKLRKQGNDLVVYRPSPAVVTQPNSLRPQTASHINVNHFAPTEASSVSPAARAEIARSRPVIPNSPDLGAPVSGSQPPAIGRDPARPYMVWQNSGTATRNLATTAQPGRAIGTITDQSGSSRIVSQPSRGMPDRTPNNAPAANPSFRPQVSRVPETTALAPRQEPPRYTAPQQQPQPLPQQPAYNIPQQRIPAGRQNIENRAYGQPQQRYIAPNNAPPTRTQGPQQSGYSRTPGPVGQQPVGQRPAPAAAQPVNRPVQGRASQTQ